MKRCINIDWLEVFCYEEDANVPQDAEFYESKGYRVSRREYGTRVYQQMFTIYDMHDVPMIEVRRKPLSVLDKTGGLFDERACHIRMTNAYCYIDNPIDVLRQFLAMYNYTLVRIFRIDVALDFTQFDKGDDPQKFLKRYVSGKYSKVNQTNVSAHGSDKWEHREWQSISWGKPKSMISTKFYCKSIEMQQVKDKPYIRQAWWMCGLVDNPITMTKTNNDGTTYKPLVWRVEFSIKSSAKKWYIIERADTRKQTNIAMPHTLDIYDTKTKLLQVFASLANHYFHFKIFEEGKRKDRCKDKILFDFSYMDAFYKVDRIASHTPTKTTTQRLIDALLQLKERTIDNDVSKACQKIVESLRRTQVNEFAGVHMSPDEILTLQHLIAMQSDSHNTHTIEENMQTIRQYIREQGGIF